MKKSTAKKQRTTRGEAANAASRSRKEIRNQKQSDAARRNRILIASGELTPWQQSKAIRNLNRQQKGKLPLTPAGWLHGINEMLKKSGGIL
jgi:hypothetical protein